MKRTRICTEADEVALRGMPSSPNAGLLSMKQGRERKSLPSLLRTKSMQKLCNVVKSKHLPNQTFFGRFSFYLFQTKQLHAHGLKIK